MAITDKIKSALLWQKGKKLPVSKNKVVVSSYYGRGYGDSPKAIVNELLKRDSSLDIVWLLNDISLAAQLPKGVRGIQNTPDNKIRELCTAAVWIDNCRKGSRVKKEGQFYLQTWHGFALKQIEKDAAAALPPEYTTYATRDSEQTDLIVSGSSFMTKIYHESFWYKGEVLQCGTPRNDILFTGGEGIREKVFRALGIPQDRKLILYAPTFRSGNSLENYSIEYERLAKNLSQRFGGNWAVGIRLHPNIMQQAKDLSFDGATTFDATAYDDIQELLCAADACITDYSSVMFDFMLTGRPCFQFATDISAYRRDRDFYFPIDETPFPIAENNNELEKCVLEFSEEEANKAYRSFIEKFGISEDGHASEICAEIIINHVKGDKK